MDIRHNNHQPISYIAYRLGLAEKTIESVAGKISSSRGLERLYRVYSIPKNGGSGRRIIQKPIGRLKEIQNAIFCRLLRDQKCSPIAHGCIPGRSIISALSPHDQSRLFVLADMVNAYPSVPKKRLYLAFRDLGFYGEALEWMVAFTWDEVRGGLPQGSPSSPMLFNIAMRAFDEGALSEARNHELIVTRYVDNIIISGSDYSSELATSREEDISSQAHSVLWHGCFADRGSVQASSDWIRFKIDHYRIATETHPVKSLGAILTGDDVRLSGKIIRHCRIEAFNAVLAGDRQKLNGIKGNLIVWFGEVPPQVANSIAKARAIKFSL